MSGMFSNIKKKKKKTKNQKHSILLGENLQCQRHLPNHNHLLCVIADGTKGPENFEAVTVY